MSTSPSNGVIRELRRVRPDLSERTDRQLLEDYLRQRDDAALAALVRRHGPMVWGVCRRVLGHHQDAEDAFQATFLILVRRAGSIAARDLLANWLYGTAHLTALKARARAARLRERERQVPEMPEPATAQRPRRDPLEPALDEELSRLPARYRTVIVLCDLEGNTRQEAARQLGCPEGTVASRLARARSLLAKRFRQRGAVLSAGSVSAALARQAASAVVPHSVVDSTVHSARHLAAGESAAAVIPPRVSALTEDVMKTMLLTKLKATFAVVLALGFAATGATLLAGRSAGQEQKGAAAIKPVGPAVRQQPVQKATEFAWGKSVDGLQLGVALVPGDRTAYRPGEEITLEVAVRNVSTAPIAIQYGLPESEPQVTDPRGQEVVVAMPPFLDIIVVPTERVLKPGETAAMFRRKIAVAEASIKKPDPTAVVADPTIRVPAGKYQIAFSEFVRDQVLLSTGQVEVEVTGKTDPSRPERAGELRLTVDQAKKLLPQAAGIRNADFKALQGDPRPEAVESKSLSLVLLALKPPVKNTDAAAAEFRVLGENLKVSDITQAMWISKGEGYASFIQPTYITDCTCESTAGRAEGVVTFQSDLFAGRVPFVARATRDGWAITEFRLPQYGTKVVLGDDGIWRQVSTAGKSKPATDEPVAPPVKGEEDKEAATAWGKEIGGLQVGLSIRNRRNIRIGGRAEAAVHLRNVGTETITVSAWPFWVSGPRVVDPRGNPVRTTSPPTPDFEIIPAKLTVKPGQAVLVAKTSIFVVDAQAKDEPFPDGVVDQFTIHVRPGTFRADFRGFVREHPDLATGTVDFEVKAAETGGLTAWGEEVGGLQAGLGYRPGEKRVYSHGETVTLVVRVRNVGEEEVRFQYHRPFTEGPATVSDDAGKPVPQSDFPIPPLSVTPVQVKLAPGKEIELHELKRELRPVSESGNPKFSTPYAVYGMGNVRIQYARLVGADTDPLLSKLATGKLELEVKEAPPEKQKVLTPEEAIKVAGDSRLAREFNAKQPPVEFKVEFVTRAVLVKAVPKEGGSEWEKGHGPGDVGLRAKTPADRKQARFLAILTANAISQLNKAGIKDIEKHVQGRTIRVRGAISWCAYDGLGTPPEVEVVVDDLSHLEVID